MRRQDLKPPFRKYPALLFPLGILSIIFFPVIFIILYVAAEWEEIRDDIIRMWKDIIWCLTYWKIK